jgi:Mitochondrial glycoprotein
MVFGCDAFLQLGRRAMTKQIKLYFSMPLTSLSVPRERVLQILRSAQTQNGMSTVTRRRLSGLGKFYTIKDYVPRAKKKFNWVQKDEEDEIDKLSKHNAKKPSRKERVFKLSDFISRPQQQVEQVVTVNPRMPEHVKRYMRALRPYWKIAHVGTAITKLYRINTSRKVQLSFHCQHAVVNPLSTRTATLPTNNDASIAKNKRQVLRDQDHMLCRDHDAPVEPPPVIITLTVTGRDKRSLVLMGIADEDDLVDEKEPGNSATITAATSTGAAPAARIHHVRTTSTPVDVIHAMRDNVVGTYRGKYYKDLDPNLQRALDSFVQDDIRIDRDVVKFITAYFVYREERRYDNLLLNFHALLQDDVPEDDPATDEQ